MWRDLLIESLTRPRAGARRLLALGLSPAVLIQAAVAVTCAGMVLGYLALGLSGGRLDPVSAAILANPLAGAAIQFATIVFVAVLTAIVGRLFGGGGTLAGAVALVVWLDVLMALIQAGHLLLLLLLPPAAAILAIGALFWTFWAYINFVCELHGFQNPVLVLGGVILTLTVLFFGMAVVLATLGITPPELQ